MHKSPWLAVGLAALSLAFSVGSARAEKLPVSVLYRQDSDVTYHAVIPGYSGANADVTGACTLDPDPANCPDPRQDASAKDQPSYTLVGTTLSLGLPDGRIALVNCVSRHSTYGNYVNRHACGMPLSEHAEADFTGRSAKLVWPSPDGRKTESETYKVVAVLPKPQTQNSSNADFSENRLPRISSIDPDAAHQKDSSTTTVAIARALIQSPR